MNADDENRGFSEKPVRAPQGPVVDEHGNLSFPAGSPSGTVPVEDPEDGRDPSLGDARSRARHASVEDSTITVKAMTEYVNDPRCGAVVTFDGLVRDHDEGRGVERLEYTSHPSAGEVMEQVVFEIAERFPDVIVAASHRVGPLEIGDPALVAAVAAPHRKRAFEACDFLVDTVKKRVPIWKDQHFDDGTHEWVAAIG